MNRFRLVIRCFLVVCLLGVSTAVQGQSQLIPLVRVVDCQGHTRAVEQVPSGEPVDVEVSVQTQDVGQVTLTNSRGEVVRGVVFERTVTFSGVTPDIWVLSSDTPGALFSQISFSSTPVGFWVQAGEIALVVGGIVGAVFIADAIDRRGSSGGGDGDHSPQPPVCPACNPDQGAPSIEPFSSAG
jgi:hypothetical protein